MHKCHPMYCTIGVPEVKHRKRHRRKHFENQKPCLMRGVYFKNMKWKATIKVGKKQIHLGTVRSQEAAARLYDRRISHRTHHQNHGHVENDESWVPIFVMWLDTVTYLHALVL